MIPVVGVFPAPGCWARRRTGKTMQRWCSFWWLPPDESRIVTSDHRSIDIPDQALTNEVRRGTVVGIGKRSFGQGLEGDRGHVEKKLTQVGCNPLRLQGFFVWLGASQVPWCTQPSPAWAFEPLGIQGVARCPLPRQSRAPPRRRQLSPVLTCRASVHLAARPRPQKSQKHGAWYRAIRLRCPTGGLLGENHGRQRFGYASGFLVGATAMASKDLLNAYFLKLEKVSAASAELAPPVPTWPPSWRYRRSNHWN